MITTVTVPFPCIRGWTTAMSRVRLLSLDGSFVGVLLLPYLNKAGWIQCSPRILDSSSVKHLLLSSLQPSDPRVRGNSRFLNGPSLAADYFLEYGSKAC